MNRAIHLLRSILLTMKEIIFNEAIAANQEQLLGGVDTLPEYKYMLGIHHTLTDMKDRIDTELKKLIKETWSE